MTAHEVLVKNAQILWGGRLYYCPTTGRVIEALEGDDKAICRCGRSNPAVPTERTEQTMTHVVRFLQSATAEAYATQCERDVS